MCTESIFPVYKKARCTSLQLERKGVSQIRCDLNEAVLDARKRDPAFNSHKRVKAYPAPKSRFLRLHFYDIEKELHPQEFLGCHSASTFRNNKTNYLFTQHIINVRTFLPTARSGNDLGTNAFKRGLDETCFCTQLFYSRFFQLDPSLAVGILVGTLPHMGTPCIFPFASPSHTFILLFFKGVGTSWCCNTPVLCCAHPIYLFNQIFTLPFAHKMDAQGSFQHININIILPIKHNNT